jgi:hypothetical protein
MTPQDWHALRRYLRQQKAALHLSTGDLTLTAAKFVTLTNVERRMSQILSRRRRQRKQVA